MEACRGLGKPSGGAPGLRDGNHEQAEGSSAPGPDASGVTRGRRIAEDLAGSASSNE